MNGQLLKLRLGVNKGTVSPWHADTIFGLWCWALLEREGQTMLELFLEACQAGEPPVVFSDPFPGDTLPIPDFPFAGRAATPVEREEQIQAAKTGKRLKSLRYLQSNLIQALLKGETIDLSVAKGETFEIYVTDHVTMNRTQNRALEGGLFSLAEYRPSAGFITLYTYVESDWEDLFSDVISFLLTKGIGGKRSIGRGSMQLLSIEEAQGFLRYEQGNAFMSLSSFVPAKDDPVQGWYRIRVKRGAAGPGVTTSTSLKRPIIYLEPGATFLTSAPTRPFYGRLLRGVLPGNDHIVQSGFALAVPALVTVAPQEQAI
ncbi:MAG TPA: hypothetical protein GXX29_11775 [Firmicutes bacterium]|nr:hypothetical protein [Bacillota bacterium]